MLSFLRDYSTIVRAGVFMHSAYALRYLGTRRWIVVALAHYLLVGERRGHRPNPFFDPAHVGGLHLATYLRDSRTWDRTPCPQVDPGWYRAQHMPADARGSPFVHFWRWGFDRDRSPSPVFDLAFFRAVVAFYRADKKEFAFECFTAADADVPDDEADVCRRQQAFYDSVVMTVARRLARPRHRFLVFVQAGRDFDNPHRGPRSFDVLINYYDDAPLHDEAADYVVVQNGTKTTAVRKLLADAPDILGAYEAVLFLDDDVALETAAIDRLFAIFAARGLDLAQPSLTAASYCAFAILKQPDAGPVTRGVTSVEIMMPLLSKRALAACGFCFGEAISGWAVDLLLGVEVRRRFGDRVALIGEIVAAHERHVDLEGGAFYAFLRKHGIEATTEAGRIARRFGIAVSAQAILPAPLDEPQAG